MRCSRSAPPRGGAARTRARNQSCFAASSAGRKSHGMETRAPSAFRAIVQPRGARRRNTIREHLPAGRVVQLPEPAQPRRSPRRSAGRPAAARREGARSAPRGSRSGRSTRPPHGKQRLGPKTEARGDEEEVAKKGTGASGTGALPVRPAGRSRPPRSAFEAVAPASRKSASPCGGFIYAIGKARGVAGDYDDYRKYANAQIDRY